MPTQTHVVLAARVAPDVLQALRIICACTGERQAQALKRVLSEEAARQMTAVALAEAADIEAETHA